jgi:hypothetical protein
VTVAPPGGRSRDSQDVEALITDRYLETILAAHGRGADHGPVLAGARPARDIRLAAERLALELPRLHPSFRFEEALAGKLSEVAALMRSHRAGGGEDVVVPFAGRLQDPLFPIPAEYDDGVAWRDDLLPAIGRPLLIGGALTSAALSIAGAAYIAWRIRRPLQSPMSRAVRAVARTRLA